MHSIWVCNVESKLKWTGHVFVSSFAQCLWWSGWVRRRLEMQVSCCRCRCCFTSLNLRFCRSNWIQSSTAASPATFTSVSLFEHNNIHTRVKNLHQDYYLYILILRRRIHQNNIHIQIIIWINVWQLNSHFIYFYLSLSFESIIFTFLIYRLIWKNTKSDNTDSNIYII